jgi:hypothetical protein
MREEIFSYLFDLSEITWAGHYTSFVTRERKVRLFSDVSHAEKPYLAQAEHNETSGQTSNTPYKRVMRADWLGYFPSKEIIGSIELNLLLDAITTALAPKVEDPGYFDSRNTLLGRCYHCFIDGEIFKDPGDIDGEAMFLVPIKILVP